MASFEALSPELVEEILLHTLDSTSHVNHRRLASCSSARLIFRHVTIASPEYGAKLLETMKEDSALAGFLRTITVKIEAFAKPATFSDLAQDDLLRLAVKATSFDSPIASFAPLKDGRKPLASYPSTLQSCRLGTPFAQTVAGGYGGADTSDNEDEPVGASDATRPSKDYMSLLTSLPTTLRQLKLSQLADNSLPSVPPTSPLRSCHLTALLLDFVTVSPLFLEWLAPATLEKLQLWCVRGLSSFDIVQFVRKQAQLKELMFKPKGHRQGTRLGNELVLYLPVLEHLTLGSGACDHVIYSLLPSSLTHLCVSLPNHHQNARLLPIANEITTRLTSLKVFELYSHLYFPPPVELTYPGPEPNESSGLRELRLSHITATPGEIAAFLSSIGRRLYTLATHHISEEPSSLLEYCPSLRRLELGVTHFEPPSGTSFFRGLSAPLLNFLRVHFNSGVPLSQLLDILPHRAQSGLKTLEFIGIFPDDLPSDWRSGACIEALVEECKRSGIEWWVNGRIVESMGDFWRALVGQTGRETL
ncbi:hypothetical protein JCM6882_003879 [Rhodosporidiobolus microsporus]